MAWRGFTGMRTYDPPLQNDLRELERVMQDLNTQVGKLSASEPVSSSSTAAVPQSRILTAGNGLTGGGDLTVNRTFDVGSGTGIIVNANDIAVDTTVVVPTTRTLTAGAGLTGGGNLTADRTIDVGAGIGVSVAADSVAVDQTFTPTWTGLHTFNHASGIVLGSGIIKSNEVDGGGEPAFDLQLGAARTTDPVIRVRNTVSGNNYLLTSAAGEWAFGYNLTGVQTGFVLGFIDTTSLGAGGVRLGGILGAVVHDTSAAWTAIHSMTGRVSITSAATAVPSLGLPVSGLTGNIQVAVDATGYSGKAMASVLASATSTTTSTGRLNTAANTLLGDWAWVAMFQAHYNQTNTATNRPAMGCSLFAPVQGYSATDAWGVYIPTGRTNVAPLTCTNSAAIAMGFPLRGTNQAHMYFGGQGGTNWQGATPTMPTLGGYAAGAGGPTATKGAFYFDAGPTNVIGCYEHDGTAWRKLLTPDKVYTITGAWTFNSNVTLASGISILTAGTTVFLADTIGSNYFRFIPQTAPTMTNNAGELTITSASGALRLGSDIKGPAQAGPWVHESFATGTNGAFEFKHSGAATGPLAIWSSGGTTYMRLFTSDLDLDAPNLTMDNDGAAAQTLVLGTTNGLKIGTATSQKIGFWNATPVVRPAAYTPTNVTADRAFDANSTSIDELADVLGTLIADLQSVGLVG